MFPALKKAWFAAKGLPPPAQLEAHCGDLMLAMRWAELGYLSRSGK